MRGKVVLWCCVFTAEVLRILLNYAVHAAYRHNCSRFVCDAFLIGANKTDLLLLVTTLALALFGKARE